MEKNIILGFSYTLSEYMMDDGDWTVYYDVEFQKDFGIFKKGMTFDVLQLILIDSVIYAFNYMTVDDKWKQEIIITPK
jgi:hypothetical protein